jgi:NDP-hexose-3-ketoreductase
MRELGVAVWGLGAHATKNILPALSATPGIRIAGVCSRSAPVVAAASETYSCPAWTEADSMLQSPDVDVVFVATPIGLHHEQGRAVLAAGKQLWCEKPLAETWEQAAELVALSRSQSVVVAEAFMHVHHPQFRALLAIAESGRLGALRSLLCRFGIPALERPGFRLDPALGGGAFLDVGSYLISVVDAFFPRGEPLISFAEILTAPGSRVDTAGRAVLSCADDVAVLIEWRTGCSYRNEIDLWGTEGSVATDLIFSKPADYVPVFRYRDAHGHEWIENGEAANHFVRMFTAFRALVDDAEAADSERRAIMRRAGLADRIRNAAEGRISAPGM